MAGSHAAATGRIAPVDVRAAASLFVSIAHCWRSCRITDLGPEMYEASGVEAVMRLPTIPATSLYLQARHCRRTSCL